MTTAPADRTAGSGPPRRRRSTAAVMIGAVAILVGAALLWQGLVAPLTLATLKIAAPLGLVVVGALGLLLARR